MPVTTTADSVEKRLSERERHEPEAARRLRSEAELLERLGRAGLAGVTPKLLERGEDAHGPWHRVERIDLPTMAERFRAAAALGTPLPSDWIERAARASFAALAALHEAQDDEGPLGVVHADLSPANVLIDDAGDRTVILDFDLAWWRGGGPPRDGAFRGTVAYVAPEIARGETPTAASDLFSLAALLLHAATGAPPRAVTRGGDGTAALAVLVVQAGELPVIGPDDAARIGTRGPGHAALVACLAHDPAERPSARGALARFVDSGL